jgi:hypothetical protein
MSKLTKVLCAAVCGTPYEIVTKLDKTNHITTSDGQWSAYRAASYTVYPRFKSPVLNHDGYVFTEWPDSIEERNPIKLAEAESICFKGATMIEAIGTVYYVINAVNRLIP